MKRGTIIGLIVLAVVLILVGAFAFRTSRGTEEPVDLKTLRI